MLMIFEIEPSLLVTCVDAALILLITLPLPFEAAVLPPAPLITSTRGPSLSAEVLSGALPRT